MGLTATTSSDVDAALDWAALDGETGDCGVVGASQAAAPTSASAMVRRSKVEGFMGPRDGQCFGRRKKAGATSPSETAKPGGEPGSNAACSGMGPKYQRSPRGARPVKTPATGGPSSRARRPVAGHRGWLPAVPPDRP